MLECTPYRIFRDCRKVYASYLVMIQTWLVPFEESNGALYQRDKPTEAG
jgi:hypothetical protein